MFAKTYAQLPNFHPICAADDEVFATGRMGSGGFDLPQVLQTLQAAYSLPNCGVMTELEEEIFDLKVDACAQVEITLDRRASAHTKLNWPGLADWQRYSLASVPAFELHHAVDFPKLPGDAEPPVTLKTLMHATAAANFNVGGWFIFSKNDRWALRSNEFSNASQAECVSRLHKQAIALHNILETHWPAERGHRQGSNRASLERVHAIWSVDAEPRA